MKKLLFTCTILAFVTQAGFAQTTGTGRQITTFPATSDISAALPSLGSEEFTVLPLIPIFWDKRCAKVEFTFNSFVGANPGTPDEISPEALVETINGSMKRWNDNPSSFIEMEITDLSNFGNRTLIGGDFINEVTFITPDGFAPLATSGSMAFDTDVTLTPGQDIDGDGDSDVYDPEVEGINVCTDIDGDDDHEFPAGFYKAGTIIDNDVQFSSTMLWSLEAIDDPAVFFDPTIPVTADVDAVATHEFGHSHGLTHILINQNHFGETDGSGATMFPFIAVTEAASELAARSPSFDDLAASAFIYPEGSEDEGIAALQEGDIAFDDAYDVISGKVQTINEDPLISFNIDGGVTGAAVYSVNNLTGEVMTQSYSGTATVFADPDPTSGIPVPPIFMFFESLNSDGSFLLPVPKNTVVQVRVEAPDGDPITAIDTAFGPAESADFAGQLFFPEEGFNFGNESNIEFLFDAAVPFFSAGFLANAVNILTNEESFLTAAVETDFAAPFELLFGVDTFTYAEVIDRDSMLFAISLGFFPIAGDYLTGTFDPALTVAFENAQLALGRVSEDGSTLEIEEILQTETGLVTQDDDFTRFPFSNPQGLRFELVRKLRLDPSLDVVLLLEADTSIETRGVSFFSPSGVSVDTVTDGLNIPLVGSSFQSIDGGPFTVRAADVWNIQMRFLNDGKPVPRFLQFDFPFPKPRG